MKRLNAIWFWCAAIPASCSGACGTVPPTPDPMPVTDYSLVCQHLADLGCPEGRAPECAVAFGRFQDSRMTDLRPSCLMAAQSATAARACGSVLCEGAR